MDYYETLGISKTATAAEIKQAYRKLASKHHPDKGGDTIKFQAIQAAYDTLGDEAKRAAYDRPQPPPGFQRGPGGFHFSSNGVDLGELFRHMAEAQQGFGQSGFHRVPQLLRTLINVTLNEVYSGGSRTLTIQTDTGNKALEIDVPKGVRSGDQIKYNNVIDDAILVVEFRVEPHLKFDRRGNDLFSNFPISVLELIVGTTISVTTLSNKTLSVNVPAGTQPNMQLKIAGQGLPVPGTNLYGDQYLLLKPLIPANIDKEIIDAISKSIR